MTSYQIKCFRCPFTKKIAFCTRRQYWTSQALSPFPLRHLFHMITDRIVHSLLLPLFNAPTLLLLLLAGFGENCRVLEWVLRRCDNEDVAEVTPIGYIPKSGAINIEGLGPLDMEKMFDIPKDYWLEECQYLRKYYEEQLGEDLPQAVLDELNALEERLKAA